MKKILKIILILLLVICSVTIFIFIVPLWEGYTLKESSSDSVGNCRIVNIVESINKNLELRVYYSNQINKNGNHLRHVLAVNDEGKIVDKSDLKPDKDGKISSSLDGDDLSSFEQRNPDKPNLEFIYYKNHEYDIINKTADTYFFIGLIKAFTLSYKIFH